MSVARTGQLPSYSDVSNVSVQFRLNDRFKQEVALDSSKLRRHKLHFHKAGDKFCTSFPSAFCRFGTKPEELLNSARSRTRDDEVLVSYYGVLGCGLSAGNGKIFAKTALLVAIITRTNSRRIIFYPQLSYDVFFGESFGVDKNSPQLFT